MNLQRGCRFLTVGIQKTLFWENETTVPIFKYFSWSSFYEAFADVLKNFQKFKKSVFLKQN